MLSEPQARISRAGRSTGAIRVRLLSVGLALVLAAVAVPYLLAGGSSTVPTNLREKSMSVYDLSVKDIDGKTVSLKEYQGKVALVVNVASQCGFTPQYEGLQKIYQEYKGKGLVVLGFPSNEFGGQEPGTEAEIKQFCSLKYHVDFPMFSKVIVKKGADQSEIYKTLTANLDAPMWNFTKYLVGKDGKVLATFGSRVKPDSDELKQAIDAALK